MRDPEDIRQGEYQQQAHHPVLVQARGRHPSFKEQGRHPLYCRLLGHDSLSTTQRYTHVEISDFKRVHSLTHPREKEKWKQPGDHNRSGDS
jgi:hypothetical protein